MAKYNIVEGGYLMLELIPAMVVLVLASFTFVSLLVCMKCDHSLARKISDFLWTALHKLSRFIYKDLIEEAHSDDDKGPQSVIRGKKVPWIIIAMIGAYSFALGLFAAMTFWDVFLLRVTYACDDGLDCFPNATNPFTLHPIQNCSTYEDVNDAVTCYAFVFQFGTAAGVAAGLITGANHVLRGITSTLLAAYDKLEEKKKTDLIHWTKLRRGVIICQHFVAVLFSLLFVAASCAVIMILDYVNKLSISNVVNAVSLLLTIVLAVSIPWYKVASAGRKDSYEKLEDSSNYTIQ